MHTHLCLVHPAEPTPHRGERGEGVISTAIAVLIITILGGVAYIGFKEVLDSGNKRAKDTVEKIGAP
jgi:hypothetical protein